MIPFSRPVLVASTLSALLVVAGCGQKESSTASADDTLRIGIIESVTGPAASYGAEHNQGTRLAVEEINRAGGFNGHPIEVHGEDDKTDPATGINAAKKLITQANVDAVVGSSASLVTIAFSKENEKYKVPLVNGMAGSPTITEQGYKYTWRIKITDNQLDSKAIEHLVQQMNAKKIAFLAENSDYGKPPTKAAADRARELGADVVAYEEYNRGETDFKAQLTNIRDKAPDVLFVHGYYTEGSIIARQVQELGIKTQLLVNEGQGVPKFQELAGAAAEGVIFPTTWLPGLDDARSKRFEAAYLERYKVLPGAFAAGSYEAVYTVLAAAKKGGGATPEKIQAGLSQLQDFDTLLGKVRFDAKNQNDGEIRLARFNAGKIEPLK